MPSEKPVAIVTGAGRGIGKAIALTLAGAGYNIAIGARTTNEIDAVAVQAEKLGAEALALDCDVAREPEIRRLVDKTVDRWGRIDVLVNNAGIGVMAPVMDLKVEDWDRMFATNIRGTFLATKAVLPEMVRRKSGDIINIASLAGRNAFKGGAGYGATKWAMIGFARSLMLEVREHNIRVITICPGSVDTAFDPRGDTHKNTDRIPKADDIAAVVLDAVRMPRNVMVSEIDVRPTNPNW